MTQRRLRLGDVLDDYCPRERRITNHAVVAMIEDTVKQTRCTTCDAEHEYKQAKVPAARRRKTGVSPAQLVEGAARLPEESDMHEELPSLDESAEAADNDGTAEAPETVLAVDAEEETGLAATSSADSADGDVVEDQGKRSDDDRDEWPVHRPLIRAQLPRPEGHIPERKAPDFTIRQGGKFDPNRNGQRHRGRPGGRQAQGQGQPGQGGTRFGGPRGQGGHGGQGGPQGQRQGNRPGQGGGGGNRPPGPGRGPRPGGGRKRGR
jgi:hypothetical protein